jgi:hypothetical protein
MERNVSQPNAKIRIVALPLGEAPFWVRQERVGLEVPLTRYTTLMNSPAFGALTAPSTWLSQVWALLMNHPGRVVGYAVEGERAVEILEAKSPDAQADRGEFATDEQVRAIWAKYNL